MQLSEIDTGYIANTNSHWNWYSVHVVIIIMIDLTLRYLLEKDKLLAAYESTTDTLESRCLETERG